MPKMSTETARLVLNGATMGTRWALTLHPEPGFDPAPLRAACQAEVDRIDAQMSTWKPDSDLMRFNAAPPGEWRDLPPELMEVLQEALFIGRESGGAFEIAMGDAVRAWGFGPVPADEAAIRAAMAKPRRPSFEVLELDPARGRARKHAEMSLDLCGIAKGYGVDRLIAAARVAGITCALAAIDGELRAIGKPPGDRGWAVALERPDFGHRAIHAMFELTDLAIATSGDYRHWVRVGDRHLAHTMDPARGAPLIGGPASVTVLAESCIRADALASACMVLGESRGRALAARLGAELICLTAADRRTPMPGAV
ncbi:thiamine biosynthesis lipoprotein ApbE [Rhodobacter capsulatus YW2]|nr:thiamine biosynthesis lipoprotein ApbE [Rhodobacter capsulatus YW1]ETD88747.1 thiamine biosynthesis lipoprotein ApbE [Rhodobacter capsulatus YW2]